MLNYPQKISLKEYNRDRANLWLEKVEGTNYYILKSDASIYQEYVSVSLDTDGSICAIDPPGGPFLAINDKVTKSLIISNIIEDPYIKIYLEKI